jgi:hypothetical protein
MVRNLQLLARRPLDSTGRPIARFTAIERAATAVATVIVIVLLAGAGIAEHQDSVRRTANIQAALTARGLGPARVERVWKRVYRCRRAYLWRTATASGSACTDSFSSSVTIYGPGQQPFATAPPAAP